MNRMPLVALAAALAGGARAADPAPSAPQTAQERATYSLGYQMGQDLKAQGVEVRPDALRRGAADALEGAEPRLRPDEMRRTLLELKRRITSQAALESRRQGARERAEAQRFLAENATKEGVVSLPSGLQYKVIQEGKGPRPGLDDRVSVNYRASLVSGVEFDSTEEEGPATFQVREVIPGWREGLQLMQEGARWQLFVPPSLGYGVRGPLAEKAVILDVELLKVGAEAAADRPAGQPAGEPGDPKDQSPQETRP